MDYDGIGVGIWKPHPLEKMTVDWVLHDDFAKTEMPKPADVFDESCIDELEVSMNS